MDPRQEPQALFDELIPPHIRDTQLSFSGVRVLRWTDRHIWLTLKASDGLPESFEVCFSRERLSSLIPAQIAFLIMEIELLPRLASGMDFAAREGSMQQGAAALDRYISGQDTYEQRLLRRFFPFFDAARVRGAPIEEALLAFTLIETGVSQRLHRRKPGRPPKGERAMSNAERQRRFRDNRNQRKLEGTGATHV